MLVIALFASFATFVSAQEETVDIVKLKNGSIIKGKILEIRPQEHVKIELRDGSIFVFKMEEVESITREQVKKQESNDKKNVIFFNPVQLGVSLALGMPDFTIEFQRAINRYLSVYATPEVGLIDLNNDLKKIEGLVVGSTIGFYLMPLGEYINGFYIRAGVFYGLLDWDLYADNIFAIEGLVGYQAIFRSGFSLSFGAGVRFYTLPIYSLNFALELAKIGYAW